MLETCFVRPQTIDRIRALWVGPEIERYVAWLAEQGYSTRSVLRRVPLLAAFGEFARMRGARSVADLPGHVDAFVSKRAAESRDARRDGVLGRQLVKEARGQVEHMLEFAVPGFRGTGRPHRAVPFAGTVPGFFEYLVTERGLRPASVVAYQHHPGPLRGLPAADRRCRAGGAVPGDPRRLCRRALKGRPGQDDRAARMQRAAGVLAPRAP